MQSTAYHINMTSDDDTNHPGTEQGLLANENSHTQALNVVSPSLDETRFNWKECFSSFDFVELVCSALFLVAGLVLEAGGITPRIRPIPYQRLESSGEYVVNQVFNEAFEGETISSKSRKVLKFCCSCSCSCIGHSSSILFLFKICQWNSYGTSCLRCPSTRGHSIVSEVATLAST